MTTPHRQTTLQRQLAGASIISGFDGVEHRSERTSRRIRHGGSHLNVADLAMTSAVDFRAVTDLMPEIVWVARADGSTEYSNGQAEAYSGSPTTGSGWTGGPQVHEDDAERVWLAWAYAVLMQTPYDLDYRICRDDGEYRWHAFRARPIRGSDGCVIRWIGTATDIDDAKRVESDLRLADRRSAETLTLLETLLSRAPVGFGFIDREFRLAILNETLAAFNGSTVAEQVGRRVADIVPLLWPQLEVLYRQIFDSGEAVLDIEIQGSTDADPLHTHCWSASYYPVVFESEVLGIGMVVVDITARKEADEAVRFQAELLAAVGHAMVAVDLAGVITYWNKAASDLYGWSAAEAVGRMAVDVLPFEQTTEHASAMSEAIRRGENTECDFLIKRRDGSTVTVHVTSTPVLDGAGNLVAVIGSSTDVTERRTGEEVRRELAAIVEGSGDAILGWTTDGYVKSCNSAAERLFGYTAAEVVGKPVSILAPADKVGEQVMMRERLNNGGPPETVETKRRRKDGTIVDVLVTYSSATDEAGKVVGLSVIARDITARRVAQRGLEASERRLAEAQRTGRIGSFELDVATGVVTWSDEFARILGLERDAPSSAALFISMVHPDDRLEVSQGWRDTFERGCRLDLEFRVIRTDLVERSVHARAIPDIAADGSVVKVAGTVMDESERVQAERVRRAAETQFEIGFEQSAIGALISDLDGAPTRVNPAMCDILGRPAELLIGRRWTEFTHPDEVPLGQVVLARVAAGHDTYADERRYVRPDGSVVWAFSNVALVRDEAGEPQYFFVQLQDITSRKQAEVDLAHQVLHDSRTGLPNRALLTDRLMQSLAASRRRGTQLGVMILGIDHFKLFNDSFGYSAGNDLLKEAAARISAAIRSGDTAASFGGDDFVVICEDISALEFEQTAERILEALGEPWHVGGQQTRITASLGITMAYADATPENVLRDAESAMGRAKERGRNRIELFDDALRCDAARRLATTSALQHALEHNEFTLHYQPVVDLSTGEMVRAEALLRWEHPGRGVVSPTEFIPLAEETGLIVPIGAWVLEQACHDLVEWQKIQEARPAAQRLSVAVNLSIRQIMAPSITRLVREILQRTGLRPSDLCLELTESLFVEDVDFGKTLTDLKMLGIGLSIDDFGTGYSSLSRLKNLPVDAVKIDKSFVDGLGTDPHDTAIVGAIVSMAHALDLEVTAEGVETAEQLHGLEQLHVARVQGFHLAKPMTAGEIAQLVAESHHWHVGQDEPTHSGLQEPVHVHAEMD